MKQAFIDEYLTVDVSAKVKGIPSEDKLRASLTLDEVKRLADTPCESDVLRRASFFSILTGLRHIDIKNLKWKQISQTSNGSWRIDISQIKTKVGAYLPISDQAYAMCGTRPEDEELLVFAGLQNAAWISKPLKKWIEAAGIKKHITFHLASHSKFFYLLNISELSILKNMTANDLETSYILFLSQLCNIQRTL